MKCRCDNDVNYSRWNCDLDVTQALKWLIVRAGDIAIKIAVQLKITNPTMLFKVSTSEYFPSDTMFKVLKYSTYAACRKMLTK